jgi:hypothetical protein
MVESALHRERNCSTEKDMEALATGSKRVCLPIEPEEYQRILFDPIAFRQFLDPKIAQYPELFPQTITGGYTLHDILPPSKKMPDIRLRRINVADPDDPNGNVFTIAPSFVLPYMMGYTDDVEKALFLRGEFGVPYWGLTHVFGHNDMYWERLELGLGRNSIVGTTVKRPDQLPQDVLADEKHTRLNGDTVYVATTVGDDCVLGASVAVHADEKDLTEAYQQFKTEAQNVQPDYQPATVNTDGWAATQLAWQSLFANIMLIACFLHAFIKIRDRCKRMQEHFSDICKRVWDTYHATSPQLFMDKCAALKTWATQTLPPGPGLDAILKLCARAPEFIKAYEYPTAHRTSNMLDRLMDHMDRLFYTARYFHGHLMTAEYGVRAGALLANFLPYCPRATVADQYQSPANKLNGFVYHKNWLHNLLISASMGGYRQ